MNSEIMPRKNTDSIPIERYIAQQNEIKLNDMKKKLIITGQKVHDIGYRPFLLGLAESMEIERFFVENTFLNDKQVVYALVDSSEENVDSFVEIASSKHPEKSEVDKVEMEDYNGNVMKIESFYRYLTAMQLSKIANYGGKMLDMQGKTLVMQEKTLDKQEKTLGLQEKSLGLQEKILDLQEKTLDKQDLHIEITKNGFNNILNKQDELLKTMNYINSDTSEMKSTMKTMELDIRDARFSLTHLIETKFKEHDADIAQIKTTLAKVQEAIKAT